MFFCILDLDFLPFGSEVGDGLLKHDDSESYARLDLPETTKYNGDLTVDSLHVRQFG